MTKENMKKANAYAGLSLRKQLYLEARAMAEHALANGSHVPAEVIKTIESFTTVTDVTGNEEDLSSLLKNDADIDDLVDVHNMLVKIVEPAKPRTILLLDMEQKTTGFWKLLGPVSLIRQMILASITCLALFVLISLSGHVNSQIESSGILESQGIPLLLNLLFYLAAAGLGASFAGLYKANSYITKGTFDTTYHASYWIRFLLGLIAGLIIAVLVSEQAFDKATDVNRFLEPGIIRPLLAMLGGFSASLVYTILNRLVETVQSLFRGSSSELISAKVKEAGTHFAAEQVQQNVKVVSNIMNAQKLLNENKDPEEVQSKLNHLIKDIMPGAVMAVKK